MKKKRFLGFLLVLIVLTLLMGCEVVKPGAKKPEEVEEDVHKGVKGLAMNFARNLPPSKMFDTDALDIVVEMENKGASDLTGNRCWLHLAGYDLSIFPNLWPGPYQCGALEARSIYNPDGGFDTKQFMSPAYSIFLPEGIDYLPQTFVVHGCYEYVTKARPIVCINPRLYDIRAATEACVVQDVAMAGGQGAPVAVTNVKVQMMKDRALFTVTIANSGTGTVLNEQTSLLGDVVHSCPNKLEYQDIDIIRYNINIDSAGASLLSCSPEMEGQRKVRLVNNQAKIICTFAIYGDTAFTTPLKIDLYYNYLDSISKQVEIIKTPG
jgi:hypothetical protein